MISTHAEAPTVIEGKMMVTKDKWVTEAQVFSECEKLRGEGIAIEAINGNMVIDRLGTKGRHTVYRYVEKWSGQQVQRAALPPFVLADEDQKRLVAVFTGMMGEAMLADRQATADQISIKDVEIAAIRNAKDALLRDLDSTEKERDEAIADMASATAEIAALKDQLVTPEARLMGVETANQALLNRISAVESAKPGGDPEGQINLL